MFIHIMDVSKIKKKTDHAMVQCVKCAVPSRGAGGRGGGPAARGGRPLTVIEMSLTKMQKRKKATRLNHPELLRSAVDSATLVLPGEAGATSAMAD